MEKRDVKYFFSSRNYVFLIKKRKIKTSSGEAIIFQPKKFSKGQGIGGLIYSFGWEMRGACPGRLFAQIETGDLVIFVTLVIAIAGIWVNSYFHEKLPH